MRVAVCLSGDMRGGDNCLKSLMECVVTPFERAGATVDILIHTRLDPWWEPAIDLPFRMLRVERNVKRIDDSDIVGPINPKSKGDFPGESRRSFLYQAFLQYYRSLAGVGELKRRAEEQDGAPYDWVVRARPDVGYKTALDPSWLTPGVLHFPAGDWWRYKGEECRSDKFAIGPSKVMDVYFNRQDFLKDWCEYEELHAEGLMMATIQPFPWKVLDDFGIWLNPHGYTFSLRPDA